MKKMIWFLSVAVILITSIEFYRRDRSPTSNMTSHIADATAVDRRLRTPLSDGASQYKINAAIAASKTDEQNPLRFYRPLPGLEGRRILEEISDNISATAQSANLALALSNSGILSSDEKIGMLQILARLHNRENTTGANNDIALALKGFSTDPDKQVAAQAAIKYARLDYQPGTEYVLKKALETGALDNDSYFQELAHLIPSSPLDKKKEFLAEIRAAGSLIGRDVLVMALNSGEEFNAASFLKSSEDMAELLRTTEPKFGPLVGLGLGDAVRYTEWLRASAAIESYKTGRGMDEVIVARLSQPNTDERKVMSFLLSPQAGPMLAAATPDSPVQKLVAVAQVYASQSPGNPTMVDFVQAIRERMKNPPPPPPPVVLMPPTGPAIGPSPAPAGYPTFAPPSRQ